MFGKILRFCVGVLMLPISTGVAYAFYRQVAAIQQVRTPELTFLFGITIYLAFHVLVGAPTRAYVFGHELMHAAAAWISGGQVKGFKVGSKKGSVKTDKITGFVALAPYLIPIYAILWAVLYGAAALFWDVKRWSGFFFLMLGAAFTFHLVFTVTALKEKQTDMDVLGPLISLNLILIGNITIVVGVIALMIPEVRFMVYLLDGFRYSKEFYQAVITQLFAI